MTWVILLLPFWLATSLSFFNIISVLEGNPIDKALIKSLTSFILKCIGKLNSPDTFWPVVFTKSIPAKAIFKAVEYVNLTSFSVFILE